MICCGRDDIVVALYAALKGRSSTRQGGENPIRRSKSQRRRTRMSDPHQHTAKVKGVGQECPTHTDNLYTGSMRASSCLLFGFLVALTLASLSLAQTSA